MSTFLAGHRKALAAAALVCTQLTLAGAQTADGPALLAAFKTWHKADAPSADWSAALQQYRAKLIHDGLTAAAADRAIRLVTAYDEAELYDAVYAKPPAFNTKPSQLLADATRALSLEPGRALDVGMGSGRNALYLARAGWDVTGFDVSSVGVRQAEAIARAEELRLTAVVAADEEFDFGTSQWDLIVLVYTIEKRSIRHVREALRPGGVLVVEAGINPDPTAAFGYAPGELLRILEGFEIVRHEQLEDSYDWGPERIQLVRVVARKPLR